MLPSVATLLCASTILSGAWARPASHRGPCQVEARVRAEDLYPNAIINGATYSYSIAGDLIQLVNLVQETSA